VLGDEIRKARITAEITQEELAFRAKLSRNYISLLELNEKSPTFDTLTAICQALGIRVSVLVARVERHEQQHRNG
jgi:transcriptional regulator with XRE-family HTH domain